MQRVSVNQLNQSQLVERMVEDYQNNRPDRNQNNQETIGGENGRPNGQNEGLNENQTNDQNNVPENVTNGNNIDICPDHNLEYTVCKLTFLVCWFEIIKDTVTILKFSQISVLFLKRYFLESNDGYNYSLSRIDNYWG